MIIRAGDAQIRVSLDTSFFFEWGAFVDQVPYAVSLALNRTAKLAGKHLRDGLPEDFTVRNKWTQGGIGIPKDKSKWASKERLQIEVGAAQEYMRVHALGGQRPAGAKPTGAVPVGARKNKSDITKRNEWPRALLRQKKAFRQGRMIRATEKYGLLPRGALLYWITKDADIELPAERWPLEVMVRETFQDHWEIEGRKAMRFAVATARRRG